MNLAKHSSLQPGLAKPSRQPQRLAWLEGIRMLAAVMILLYHAQLLISEYAYTPQPTGVLANLQAIATASDRLGLHGFSFLAFPVWFGYQFVDVFVLISGFSLVLSLKGQPIQPGRFIKQRVLRILFPFWTVAWLSVPCLWLVGTLTNSYIPNAWNLFAAATFPLLFDYSGELLLPISGPWWFVSLILSFAVVFPFLWRCLQTWGSRNLLLVSLGVTLVYRALAVYVFGGHPTYMILDTPANWFPFLAFLAKLSTFVVGMVVARWSLRDRGPILWSQRRALAVGVPLYVVGFVCQFYRVGWIVADLLVPLGLLLVGMVAFRAIAVGRWAATLRWLGKHSYSYFLIHNFVVDRTINLFVQGDLERYYLALPGMLLGTLALAVIADGITPLLRQGLDEGLRELDGRLSKKRSVQFPVGPGRSLR